MQKFFYSLGISLTTLVLAFSPIKKLAGQETCSRSAVINYQEILIDTNSTQKGEGLRFYLEKDPAAAKYLDKYQQGTEIKWANIIMGTSGSILTLGGLVFANKTSDKKAMIIGGVSLLIINYLTAQTAYYGNERNLDKAIREYNQRNNPKIYYEPENDRYIKDTDLQSKNLPLFFFNIARSF